MAVQSVFYRFLNFFMISNKQNKINVSFVFTSKATFILFVKEIIPNLITFYKLKNFGHISSNANAIIVEY